MKNIYYGSSKSKRRKIIYDVLKEVAEKNSFAFTSKNLREFRDYSIDRLFEEEVLMLEDMPIIFNKLINEIK